MNGISSLALLLALAAFAYAGASSPEYAQQLRSYAEAAQQSPRGKACFHATCFFGRALCEDRLPDCNAAEHGCFTADMGPLREMNTVTYPISFTFKVSKRSDSALYCYTVEKRNRFSRWRFTDGWKEAKSGKRLLTLSVPG